MPTIDDVIARTHIEFKIRRLIYEVVEPDRGAWPIDVDADGGDDAGGVSPVEVDGPEFAGRLARGTLVLVPKIDFGASVQSAMARADEFLHAWEIAAGVALDRAPLEFRFRHAEASCKDAATGAPVDFFTAVMPEFVEAEIDATPPIVAYPGPPQVSHPDLKAEALWYRYRRFMDGKAELLATAYACLSILETGHRSRAVAAKQLAIEVDVLRRVGELSSTRGDEKDARKVAAENKPLTVDEKAWLRNALKAIIMHLLDPQPGRVLKLEEIKPLLP